MVADEYSSIRRHNGSVGRNNGGVGWDDGGVGWNDGGVGWDNGGVGWDDGGIRRECGIKGEELKHLPVALETVGTARADTQFVEASGGEGLKATEGVCTTAAAPVPGVKSAKPYSTSQASGSKLESHVAT